MRFAPIAVVLVACGAPAEQLDVPPLVPGAPIPWPVIHIKGDADAMKVWGYLDPRGRDYQEKLADIPDKFRFPMALALLRDGRLECPTADRDLGCGKHEQVLRGMLSDSGLDDGCFRRKVVEWAVAQVPFNGTVWPSVAKLAALPLPERALHAAVLRAFGRSAPELVEAVEKTGDEETADTFAATLSGDDLPRLAEAGVDGAIEAMIAWKLPVEILARAARASGHVRRETWLHLIAALQRERSGLGALSVKTIDDAIAVLVASGDCELGGAAGVSDSAYRQTSRSAENWSYMACFWLVAQGAGSRFLRDDLVSKQGLRVDGAVRPNDAAFEMPYADELPDALEGCSDTVCPLPGTPVRFRLTLDGKGRLEAIERYEEAGGC